MNIDNSSATIYVPFGAETMENDSCTAGTARNDTTGTGTGRILQRKPRSGTGRLFSAGLLRGRRGFMLPSGRRPRFFDSRAEAINFFSA